MNLAKPRLKMKLALTLYFFRTENQENGLLPLLIPRSTQRKNFLHLLLRQAKSQLSKSQYQNGKNLYEMEKQWRAKHKIRKMPCQAASSSKRFTRTKLKNLRRTAELTNLTSLWLILLQFRVLRIKALNCQIEIFPKSLSLTTLYFDMLWVFCHENNSLLVFITYFTVGKIKFTLQSCTKPELLVSAVKFLNQICQQLSVKVTLE